jgi:hypothetical protein
MLRLILLLPKVFMWCCLALAALVFLPFAALTRKS